MQRYSVQFRNTILQKMIGPEKRKAADLSEEFGVSAATIYGWKSKLKDGTLLVLGNESTSHERIPSEKLKLVLTNYIAVYYNRKRIHSSIGMVSPVDYEEIIQTKCA